MTIFYKFTAADRHATHASGYRWDRLKKWQPAVTPVMCQAGYHLTTSAHLVDWLSAELWVAEGRGKTVYANNKVAFEQARLVERITAWDERLARHFAADCAERVLPIFERQVPGNDRPRKAIEAARAFADGLITEQEMGAARDAARAAWAARDAAWDAAWAARDAAWAARAARDAENDWQARHLCDLLGIPYEPISAVVGVA